MTELSQQVIGLEQSRKECSEIGKNIEAMLAGWLGELQLKYLTAYLAEDLSGVMYKDKISNLTFLYKILAETSLERQRIYG